MRSSLPIALSALLATSVATSTVLRAQGLEIEAGALQEIRASLRLDLLVPASRQPLFFLLPGLEGPKAVRVQTACAPLDDRSQPITGRSFRFTTEVRTQVELRDGERITIGGLLESNEAKVNRRGILRDPAQVEVPLEDPPVDVDFKDFGLRLEVQPVVTKGVLREGETWTCVTLVVAVSEPEEELEERGASRWRTTLQSAISAARQRPSPPPGVAAREVAADGSLVATTSWVTVTALTRTNLKKLGWLGTAIPLSEAYLGEDGAGPAYSSACTALDAENNGGTGRALRYDYELSASPTAEPRARTASELLAKQQERITRKGNDTRGRELRRLADLLGEYLAEKAPSPEVTIRETYEFKGVLRTDHSLLCGTALLSPSLLATP